MGLLTAMSGEVFASGTLDLVNICTQIQRAEKLFDEEENQEYPQNNQSTEFNNISPAVQNTQKLQTEDEMEF